MRKKHAARQQEHAPVPADFGLSQAQYTRLLAYLFARPEPAPGEQEWYWTDTHEVAEGATAQGLITQPADWLAFQVVLFAHSGAHLAPYSDRQVAMGLGCLINNAFSHIPYALSECAQHTQLVQAWFTQLPALWEQVLGPRLAEAAPAPELAQLAYMWFDVWPMAGEVARRPDWQDAVWIALRRILALPYRHTQMAALHGIGHLKAHLQRDAEVERVVAAFIRSAQHDAELRQYAQQAQQGLVL